jgi:uncharacterized membrane protein HdeD (DUF308 family)
MNQCLFGTEVFMRVLTVMSGVIISATGAWCLAYYRSAFSSIAFVLAIAMTLSGVFLIGAYLVSRKKSLPDTILIEGMLTLLFGFVTLNNEVTDTAMAMFFGAWLTTTGLIRFTQSLAVSRFDPKNWARILPLSILSSIFGFIMLMHSLISTLNQLTLVGSALILNGLSQLVYAMYMVRHDNLPQTELARERVEAKQAVAEAKRKERDELRRLTRSEREARKKELRDAAAALAENKKRLARIEKQKQKAAREALLEPTIQLTETQMAEIAGAMQQGDASLSDEASDEAATDLIKTQEVSLPQKTDEEPELQAVPETEAPVPVGPKTEEPVPIASAEPTSFAPEESVTQPEEEPEMSWESLIKEPAWQTPAFPHKPDITEILEREVKKPEPLPFTPLSLEELIAQEKEVPSRQADKKKEEEDQRFTEEFSWHWPPKTD